jgi:hypothetical protein
LKNASDLFQYGMQEGDNPLCELEEQDGTEWRSDKFLKTNTGKSQPLK